MTEPLEAQEQRELLETLSWVLDKWGIEPRDRIRLLGLPQGTAPRALQKYCMGAPLPDQQAFLHRASHLLAIENAVTSLFPGSPAMAAYWVTTPSNSLGGKSPLAIMLEQDLAGMHFILDHLNGEWQ